MGKEDLFKVMLMDSVAKVELLHSENKTLTNPNVCRVNIYLRININDICTLVGECKAAKQRHTKWNKGNEPFVSGFGSVIKDGFMKWSKVQKLRTIGEEEGIDFAIPKHYDKLVAQFDHYKFA